MYLRSGRRLGAEILGWSAGWSCTWLSPHGLNRGLHQNETSQIEYEMREVLVTTFYLEMTSPDHLKRCTSNEDGLLLSFVDPPLPELNRFFYTTIGAAWYWVDRLEWTTDDWHDYLQQPGVETWELSMSGQHAGYFELNAQQKGDVEIVYFGLLPDFTGKGLGAHLLTVAVDRAWSLGARRVWLHTCSLDDPRALPHYLARGFEQYKEEESLKILADGSPGMRIGAKPSTYCTKSA